MHLQAEQKEELILYFPSAGRSVTAFGNQGPSMRDGFLG